MIESPKKLKNICQAQPVLRADSRYGRNIMRRISIYLTWLLLHTPITATQTTILSMGVGLGGGILLGFTNKSYSFIGIVLIFLCGLLDYVDGEIARYKRIQSYQGCFVDLLAHQLVDSCIFIGIGFNIYHNDQDSYIFILVFLAIVAQLLIRNRKGLILNALEMKQKEKLGKKINSKIMCLHLRKEHSQITLLTLIRFLIMAPTEGGFWLVFFGVFFNKLHIVVLVFAIFLPIYVLYIVYSSIILLRDYPDS